MSNQNLFQTVNEYCRTKSSFQKGRCCQSHTNIAFCLTKAATNNTNFYEYFSTNWSLSSYKFCQTVNSFFCSCSSFDELLLSAVCDCPTSFVVSFLELSKSPPSTKVEKRTTAKNLQKQHLSTQLMWALAQVLPDILSVLSVAELCTNGLSKIATNEQGLLQFGDLKFVSP